MCLSVCFHTGRSSACFYQILKVKSVNSEPLASPNRIVKIIINKFKHTFHLLSCHWSIQYYVQPKQTVCNSVPVYSKLYREEWRMSILLHKPYNPVFHYISDVNVIPANVTVNLWMHDGMNLSISKHSKKDTHLLLHLWCICSQIRFIYSRYDNCVPHETAVMGFLIGSYSIINYITAVIYLFAHIKIYCIYA